MYWVILTMLVVVSCLVYLSLVPKTFSPNGVKSTHIVVGLGIITILGSIDGYFGVSNGNVSRLLILLLLLTAIWKHRRRTLLIFKSPYVVANVLIASLVSILIHGVNPKMYQFVNPDPYGYAAVSGLMYRYDGLRNGLNESVRLTGTKLTSDLDWADSSNFPQIGSPWYLPDFVDKYGLSNGWIHHNGLSYLFHVIRTLVPEFSGFFSLWLAVSIISLTLLSTLTAELFENIRLGNTKLTWSFLTKKGKSKNLSSKKTASIVEPNRFRLRSKEKLLAIWAPNKSIFALSFAYLVLALNSPITSMLVLDGFANQLLSFTFLFAVFNLISSKDLLRTKILSLAPTLIGVLVVYSQHLVYGIYVIFIYLTLVALQTLWKRSKAQTLFGLLILGSFGLLALFLTPASSLLFKYFFESGVGGANHLGPVSPAQALGLDPFYRGAYRRPLNEDLSNAISYQDWSGFLPEGSVFSFPSQGIPFFLNSGFFLIIQFFFLSLLIFLAGYKSKIRELWVLAIVSIGLLTVALLYLMIQASPRVIENPGTGFNDYLWMRLLFPIQIYGLPLLIVIGALFILSRKQSGKTNKSGLRLNLLYCIFSFLVFFRIADNSQFIREVGVPSEVASECPPETYFSEKLFVTDSLFPFVGLALCGHPLKVANDSFPSKIEVKSRTLIIKSSYSRDLGRHEMSEWGIVERPLTIQAPCDLECLRGLDGIKTNN